MLPLPSFFPDLSKMEVDHEFSVESPSVKATFLNAFGKTQIFFLKKQLNSYFCQHKFENKTFYTLYLLSHNGKIPCNTVREKKPADM